MKARFLALVMILLLVITGCGTENHENTEPSETINTEENKVETKFIRVKVREAYDKFDFAGDTNLMLDGNEYVYSDEGRLDKILDWGMYEKEETEYGYIYEYDENGRIRLSQRYENMDGPYAIEQELKFDENGNIYEQVTYSGGIDGREPSYYFYTYDEAGNMVKMEHYYDLEEIDAQKTYTYDENGKLTESTYTRYRNFEGHTLFYYNDWGYPIVEIEYDAKVVLKCLYLYSYIYDYDNLPIKVIVYKVTNPTKIESIMNSAQFPLFDVEENDVGIRFKEEDAQYVKVFQYEYQRFTAQQEEIFRAKKKAFVELSVWYYSYDGDYFN